MKAGAKLSVQVFKVSTENTVYPYQYGCSLNMQFQYEIETIRASHNIYVQQNKITAAVDAA